MKAQMGQTLPGTGPPKVGLAHPQAPSNTPQPKTTAKITQHYLNPNKNNPL